MKDEALFWSSSLIPHPSSFLRGELMHTLLQDLIYDSRLLRQNPGVTLIAVVTLGNQLPTEWECFDDSIKSCELNIAEHPQADEPHVLLAETYLKMRTSWRSSVLNGAGVESE
jgi:hypothetical protein